MTRFLWGLLLACLVACQGQPDDPHARLSQMTATELAAMMRTEPSGAMALLWEALDLHANDEVTKWCLHQIGTDDADPCREFVVNHADVLLDAGEFGTDQEVVDFLAGGQSATGLDLAKALVPVVDQQFAGGFARRLGRTLAAMKYRIRRPGS